MLVADCLLLSVDFEPFCRTVSSSNGAAPKKFVADEICQDFLLLRKVLSVFQKLIRKVASGELA